MEKLKLLGSGNDGRRSYYILSKEQQFFSLFPMFMLNCGFKDLGIFEDYQDGTSIKDFNNTTEHIQNKDYDIDIIYTADRIILIVRTDSKNREKLVSAVERIAEA